MPSSAVRSILAATIRWCQMASFCLLPHVANWRPAILPLRYVLGIVTTRL